MNANVIGKLIPRRRPRGRVLMALAPGVFALLLTGASGVAAGSPPSSPSPTTTPAPTCRHHHRTCPTPTPSPAPRPARPRARPVAAPLAPEAAAGPRPRQRPRPLRRARQRRPRHPLQRRLPRRLRQADRRQPFDRHRFQRHKRWHQRGARPGPGRSHALCATHQRREGGDLRTGPRCRADPTAGSTHAVERARVRQRAESGPILLLIDLIGIGMLVYLVRTRWLAPEA